jgi:hypothetical protein
LIAANIKSCLLPLCARCLDDRKVGTVEKAAAAARWGGHRCCR